MGRSIEQCPFRKPVASDADGDLALCELLQCITGVDEESLCHVRRDACRSCCESFAPTPDCPNPVVASLMFEVSQQIIDAGGVAGCDPGKAAGIQEWSERRLAITPTADEHTEAPERAEHACHYLGPRVGFRLRQSASGPLQVPVFACSHPEYVETTRDQCIHCRDWTQDPDLDPPVIDMMLPRQVNPAKINKWSVGITTAPRGRPTLRWTLDGLVRAGWESARIFIDSTVTIPQRYAHFPMSHRDERMGAWPNFYLAVTELLLRDPDADAYFILQDDVAFHDRSNLREYLEDYLWPHEPRCVVSLYSSQPDTREQYGWYRHQHAWFLGALAFIFSRDALKAFVSDADVVEHRFSGPSDGLASVDTVVGAWAHDNDVPIYYSTPSLCQHIGGVSTIWHGAKNAGKRKSDQFAGDVRLSPQPELAEFPEDEFPCRDETVREFRERAVRGKARMQESTVVICGLCRDVGRLLPAIAARIERLGEMFRQYRVVLYENDSVDQTVEFLERWQEMNPSVHIMSESLGLPRFPQVRSLTRVAKLAYYRNRCREYALSNFGDYDYVIVLDTDLEDGWSYDGIANSFGHDDWHFIGSNGVRIDRSANDPEATRLHFDSWAFRSVGHQAAQRSADVGRMVFRRGEPLVPVWSCFGGLGIYPMTSMKAASYDGEDCEHVCLHHSLRRAGLDRLFLNPSQLVLYPVSNGDE